MTIDHPKLAAGGDDGSPAPGARTAIAPLIDIAFLLLIYFLVTSSLMPREGDLSLLLPPFGDAPPGVDQLLVRIAADGQITARAEATTALRGEELDASLARYKVICEATDTEPHVVVDADDGSTHARFIKVINSLAKAGLRDVHLVGISES